ncbi:MAG: YqgE/AlgH family protein [Hyphomonadaceae bacterium]|nr:YqgE/AlgH family protein [Hyphomonadaceae bacterium]
MVSLRRFVITLGALLASAAALNAALPKPQLPTETVSLTGQLLVAASTMGDPRFSRTVILIVRHNQNGAFGMAINRPVGERPLARLLEGLGDNNAKVTGSVRIFAGGPVQPDAGFVIHSTDYKLPETTEIDADVALTASPNILRDIGRNKGPLKAIVVFGYAGWAPSQLEAELAQKAWFTLPADPALLFDEKRERVWDEAMARRPREP